MVRFCNLHCGCRNINFGKRAGRIVKIMCRLQNQRPQPVKYFQFKRQRTLGRTGHIAFHLRQLGCGKPHRLRSSLTMNKGFMIHQFASMIASHVNMIAKNIIMFDL